LNFPVRTIRLYHSENLTCGETTFLGEDSSNHLIRVLRSKVDSPVVLFNGDGFDYQCTTLDINSKKTHLSIESRTEVNNESNLKITLIQGLSRQDRMETTIQKSVELGVNKIIPVICQRSNLKTNKDKLTKKLSHWRKVAISACEQSGRCTIPEITDVILLHDINQSTKQGTLKITLNPAAEISLKNIDKMHNDIAHDEIDIIIGPEGGLNDDELLFLESNNFISVSCGPRILRTETAGPAVISALQVLRGDF